MPERHDPPMAVYNTRQYILSASCDNTCFQLDASGGKEKSYSSFSMNTCLLNIFELDF
jgi:hypothetical protein